MIAGRLLLCAMLRMRSFTEYHARNTARNVRTAWPWVHGRMLRSFALVDYYVWTAEKYVVDYSYVNNDFVRGCVQDGDELRACRVNVQYDTVRRDFKCVRQP